MKQAVMILALAAFIIPVAFAEDAWLHVSVDGSGTEAEKVRVNIPLNLIEKLLPLVKDDELQQGKLQLLHHDEETEIDIPGLLKAIEEAEDGQFVTVQSTREDVRVAKENGFFLIEVNRKGGEHETVNVKIPMTLARAFQPDASGQIDLVQVLKTLSAHQGQDLVTVTSPERKVRIWIDNRQVVE